MKIETMPALVKQTQEILASLPIRPQPESFTLPAPIEISHPARSVWQRKWLRLDCYCQAVQALADQVEQFCGRWARNEKKETLLVLAGECGCAKTHCARAICQWANHVAGHVYWSGSHFIKGDGFGDVPSARFFSWPSVVDELRQLNFGSSNESSIPEILSTSLAVLDDVGAESDPNKVGANKLCQILGQREKKFTVLTTNLTVESWPERLDVRIADRMFRSSRIVSLFGVQSYALC